MKIIKTMPQIKILDRHKVTQIERTKADQWAEREAAEAQRRSPQKKKQIQAAGASIAMKGFSKGERDLYGQVRQINARNAAIERAELERTQAYF